jgi:hypothetical protein
MPDLVRTVGRYGIIRELGRGGMAVVYLARQVDLDRLVALKELAAFHAADADFARRFVRESRLAGSLVHPNVITVFDYFEHEGTPYIAMEYVDRGSLRPYVGRMTLAQIGGVLEGVLAGLAEAEQHNIVHRDLKPENLMVTSTGTVKIADFGIAKATQVADTSAFVTATGTTVGTPPYMAPEQAMAKDVGPWTDLYSLGCMAYELFTGKPPFYDTGEPLAILLRHISEPLPPASEVAEVDADVSAWIARLTAKDPKSRPASATAAWEEFEEILIGKLGPRWRRDARLPEPPNRAAEGASSSSLPGPPAGADSDEYEDAARGGPAPPMEGIDVEGTGPDTGGETPAAEEPQYETYRTPPSGPPPIEGIDVEGTGPDTGGDMPPSEIRAPDTPVEPPVAAPPAAVEATSHPHEAVPLAPPSEQRSAPATAGDSPVPPQILTLARAGGIALLAVALLPVITEWPEHWNVFAVLSPFEVAGAAVAAFMVASAVTSARISASTAAGALIGFGAVTVVASLALLRFTTNRLSAVSTVLAVVALLGAVAMLVAGIGCLRSASRSAPAAGVDPGPLVLGLAGAVLAGLAIFVNYDGFSSLWSEVAEGDSAEFALEPVVLVAAVLLGLGLLGAQPRLAAGLLLAVGAATSLHYLGVLVAAWRAIGEVGETRSAGYIGVLGGLLVVAAGAWAHRAASVDRA